MYYVHLLNHEVRNHLEYVFSRATFYQNLANRICLEIFMEIYKNHENSYVLSGDIFKDSRFLENCKQGKPLALISVV